MTSDWSQHHLIFSRPATAEAAERVKKDPRYLQQIARQSARSLQSNDSRSAQFAGIPGSPATLAKSHRKLKRDWSEDLGSGATVGAGIYPAKFSFLTDTANCGDAPQPDFVVYGTSLHGSPTQASVVAYDNLYSGCIGIGDVPSVYWAYDTGGTPVTSPVFSRDGTKVAFVQRGGGFKSTVVLLKWAPSTIETVAMPFTIPPTFSGMFPDCVAPCMSYLVLKDASEVVDRDSNSSLFYDYTNDIAYVGDDSGWLHKITSFFNGKPTEIRTGGWPVQVNPAAPTALSSPVHDFGSGNVFVADTGGFLYRVDSTTGAVTQSGQLDFSFAEEAGPGIVQGPIVDSTAGTVFVFAASDGSGNCFVGASLYDCTAVYEISTSFVAGGTGAEVVVGSSTVSGTPPSPLYIGAFDSSYENSLDATGNLYVCGNTGGPPVLYQVPIQDGILGTPNAGPVISNSTTPCSPVSDVLNPNVPGGSTEWIFAGAQASGAESACGGGGCVMNFKNTPWLNSNAYSVGQEVVDSHFKVQVVEQAGVSGSSAPFWNGTVGATTVDGTVHWLNQGLQSAFTPAAWVAGNPYSKNARILDSNNNVQLATSNGVHTSGLTIPTFNTIPGGTTTDGGGGLVWTNVGAIATAALPAAGGASGIIFDNVVSSDTLLGASQVYFSTLSDQPCGTSGTGGCAVQASQTDFQ